MKYLRYETLIALHAYWLNGLMNEVYYGVLSKELLQSALERPCNALNYENASPLRQAAYLFHGLLMNHGFAQGNKRTAYGALEWFLNVNSLGVITASDDEIVDMCTRAENELWNVDKIEAWLVKNVL